MCKLTTIRVEKKFNLGGYESLTLGGEFSVDETDTLEIVTNEASRTIKQMFDMMQNPNQNTHLQHEAPATPQEAVPAAQATTAPAQTADAPAAPIKAPNGKILITQKGHRAELQKILNRLQLTGKPLSEADKANPVYAGMNVYPYVTLEQLTSRYEFDNEAFNAVKICVIAGQKKV